MYNADTTCVVREQRLDQSAKVQVNVVPMPPFQDEGEPIVVETVPARACPKKRFTKPRPFAPELECNAAPAKPRKMILSSEPAAGSTANKQQKITESDPSRQVRKPFAAEPEEKSSGSVRKSFDPEGGDEESSTGTDEEIPTPALLDWSVLQKFQAAAFTRTAQEKLKVERKKRGYNNEKRAAAAAAKPTADKKSFRERGLCEKRFASWFNAHPCKCFSTAIGCLVLKPSHSKCS